MNTIQKSVKLILRLFMMDNLYKNHTDENRSRKIKKVNVVVM